MLEGARQGELGRLKSATSAPRLVASNALLQPNTIECTIECYVLRTHNFRLP
jgi:hypothetical protein